MKLRVPSDRLPSDRDLTRWIKRLALILVVGVIAFTAFYAIDRWRPATPQIVDQRLATLEQTVRENPTDIASRGQLADTYVAKGRFLDAIDQYNQIIATGKAVEQATLGRASAYMGLNDLDKAGADFKAVVDTAIGGEMANSDPKLATAYFGLGNVAMKQSRPADAIVWLEKALSITRSDADAMYLIGQAFTQTGEFEKAVATLRAASAFVPVGWAEPYLALADAYAKSGNASEAEWAGAMADLSNGKSAQAEQRLKAILKSPAALDANVGLAILYEFKGDTTSAATYYRAALAIDPTNSSARLGMGRVAPVVPAATGAPATAAPATTAPSAGSSKP